MLAALPIVVLLGAMAILRLKAHIAAVAGLVTALAVAMVVFHMPTRLALSSAAFGAGYGIFPICWIILPVFFLYNLTVKTGHFATLQDSLANITDDSRLQLLLIAFALGAFFEGASGFATPVAVCGGNPHQSGIQAVAGSVSYFAGEYRAGGVWRVGYSYRVVACGHGVRSEPAGYNHCLYPVSLLPVGALLSHLGLCRLQSHD